VGNGVRSRPGRGRVAPLRLWVSVVAVAWAAVLAVTASASRTAPVGPAAGPTARDVAVFYYPWYGTPARDGDWQHWQQHGNSPPAQLASDYFPARGPYSSSDPAVVAAQMHEIAAAGIRTVIVSWWGPGSVEADRLPAVAAAARAEGLRVALHLEPYGGRTPDSLEPVIDGFRDSGITDFYVYDSTTTPDAAWRALNDRLHGVRLYANTGLVGKAEAGGFAGLYTYDVYVYDGRSFPRICAAARIHGLLCAPSVGPGYSARRATGDARVRPRRNGATYDAMWRQAIRARADAVTITSYNEWHEGTQIEPARAVGSPYASYEHAYGLVGRAAQNAYLTRTAGWAARFRDPGARSGVSLVPPKTP
jgi:glycoprotein endo-alpha-1,2-mannosidase